MSLKDEGFRFVVSPDGKDCNWTHPAEVSKYAGWTDCTDMGGDEFDAFMSVALPIGEPA